MGRGNDGKVISLELSGDEAIVLLEWLVRFNQEEHEGLFEDQSENRVLWNLEALLEKAVPEILDPNYIEMLTQAREKLRDAT